MSVALRVSFFEYVSFQTISMTWLLRCSGSFLLLVTLLPLLSTGKWYVRWWDFPRLQLVVLLFAAIGLAGVLTAKAAEDRTNFFEPLWWTLLLAGAFVWQCSHILPFSTIWNKEVPETVANESNRSFKIMVANLNYNNHESPQAVMRDLDEEQADILLLIEVDQRWQLQLQSLRKKYRDHYEYIRGEGLGMSIWSNLELQDCQTRHLVSDRRASLWTRITGQNGMVFNFVGVHPTPPGLLDSTGDTRRDSRVRDAELVLIAKEIAERQNEAWIVAGDFNDVAWSHTTRLFKRTSGLRDPRIGRSFMGTFIAQYPPFRCPIDHVFLSQGFSISDLARKRITGSDHFAVSVAVSMACPDRGVDPQPQGDDRQDAKQIVREGMQDAEQRDVATDKSNAGN